MDLSQSVKTLTRRPSTDADCRLAVAPLDFADHEGVISALRGTSTLYNTYWVRFPRGRVTFDQAVANTDRLIEAAVAAGVRRIVHLSITNAEVTSSLPNSKASGTGCQVR